MLFYLGNHGLINEL